MTQDDIDNKLIDQILAGDKALFNALVEKHKDYAFTIASNIVGNGEDGEEVAHDAFIKAYKNLNNFNKEAKFSTWLYRIVFNTAISRKRKKRVETTSLESEYELIGPTPELEKQDQRKYITAALSELNATDQTVITLFYLREYSIEEVAEITDIGTSTVKVRLHRARKRLADKIKGLLREEALTL